MQLCGFTVLLDCTDALTVLGTQLSGVHRACVQFSCHFHRSLPLEPRYQVYTQRLRSLVSCSQFYALTDLGTQTSGVPDFLFGSMGFDPMSSSLSRMVSVDLDSECLNTINQFGKRSNVLD